MHLHSLSLEDLIMHGINPKLAYILSNPETYHHDLSIIIGRTDWDYFIPEDVSDIVPLWDVNADSYVRWRRNGHIEYVMLYHDDPNWSHEAISEQGAMSILWTSWSEFQEEDDECLRFAEAIGFQHAVEALKVWKDSYDLFQEWKINLKG